MDAIFRLLAAVLHLGDVDIALNRETNMASVTNPHLVEQGDMSDS